MVRLILWVVCAVGFLACIVMAALIARYYFKMKATSKDENRWHIVTNLERKTLKKSCLQALCNSILYLNS